MKTKLKIFAPVFAMVFAIASAFATTTTSNTSGSATVPGYIDAPEPCSVKVDCSDQGTTICTDQLGREAFGKINPNDTTCPVELFRIML